MRDKDLAKISEGAEQAGKAARHLGRIGFDRVCGHLDAGMPAWAAFGKAFASVPMVDADTVTRRVDDQANDWILIDVRGTRRSRRRHDLRRTQHPCGPPARSSR